MQDVAKQCRRFNFIPRVVIFRSQFNLLLQQDSRPLGIAGCGCLLTKAGDGFSPALDIPRPLGRLVRIAEQLLALVGRIVSRQQRIEPDRRIDGLPIEPLGMRRRVGQPGQNLGELPVGTNPFIDQIVENPEIVVRQRIEHGRMSHFADRPLNRPATPDDLPGNLDKDTTPAASSLAR
jgi:hypothetical protein